jgi:hypothetical protein
MYLIYGFNCIYTKFLFLSRLDNKTIFFQYYLSFFPCYKIEELLSIFFIFGRRNHSYWICNRSTSRYVCNYFDSSWSCNFCIGCIYKPCIHFSSSHVCKYLFDIFSRYHFVFKLAPQSCFGKCEACIFPYRYCARVSNADVLNFRVFQIFHASDIKGTAFWNNEF